MLSLQCMHLLQKLLMKEIFKDLHAQRCFDLQLQLQLQLQMQMQMRQIVYLLHYAQLCQLPPAALRSHNHHQHHQHHRHQQVEINQSHQAQASLLAHQAGN